MSRRTSALVANPPSATQLALKNHQPLVALQPFPVGWTSLGAALLSATGQHADKPLLADTSGMSLTAGESLQQAAAIAHHLSTVIPPDEECVGLLLPPTVPGAVFNYALALLGKVAVNINHGSTNAQINYAIGKCKIKHVITSQAFLDKAGHKPDGELLFAQDIYAAIQNQECGLWVRSALTAKGCDLVNYFPGVAAPLDDLAAIVFTSGSTGNAKGAMLSHRAVIANVLAAQQHLGLTGNERLLGNLPFGHALGLTGTVWAPALLGLFAVYHPDPRDIRTICSLIEKFAISVIITAPTLMRFYSRIGTPEQFKSLTLVLLGSEKCKPELSAFIKEKFNLDVVEAFGTTELGPLAACNTLLQVMGSNGALIAGNRIGTVGQPIPGTAVKLTSVKTGKILCGLSKRSQGLLWFTGPQVMLGYLDEPALTAEVLVDGWYCTGDIGYVDKDGFITITDRLKRFAKVGGEMVPMGTVEMEICTVLKELRAKAQDRRLVDETSVHVTSLPDAKKGERLIVLYTIDDLIPADIVNALSAKLPALWVPGAQFFARIDALPIAPSTGKADLQALKKLAVEKFGSQE